MIKTIFRWLGFWVAAAAFISLVVDGIGWLANREMAFTALGAFWFSLSPGGLNLTQAIIERYTLPVLWDPIMISILRMPVWAVGGLIATLFLIAGRKRVTEPDLTGF